MACPFIAEGPMKIATPLQIDDEFYPFGKDDPKPFGFRIFDIKAGGMGIVYLVTILDNYVETVQTAAIKTVQEWCLTDPQVAERFSREAEVWIKLGQHANIVQAQMVFRYASQPYIIMEYVDGCDLRFLLRQNTLSVENSVKFAMQFCSEGGCFFSLVGTHRK